MKTRLRHLALACAAVTALTTAGLASASPAMKASECHAQEGRHDHSARAERMQQRMAQHHAQLKEALQLTPAQENAWQAYTAAMTPMRPDHPPASDNLTTPERMERQLQYMQTRHEQMNQRLQAMRQLYDTLSPEQRQIFDRHHQPRGRHQPTNG